MFLLFIVLSLFANPTIVISTVIYDNPNHYVVGFNCTTSGYFPTTEIFTPAPVSYETAKIAVNKMACRKETKEEKDKREQREKTAKDLLNKAIEKGGDIHLEPRAKYQVIFAQSYDPKKRTVLNNAVTLGINY